MRSSVLINHTHNIQQARACCLYCPAQEWVLNLLLTCKHIQQLHRLFVENQSQKMEELRDRYYGGEGSSRDAFEELCAMYEAVAVSTYILTY